MKEREFENIRLFSEMVAEFEYRPTACRRSYRVVVVWWKRCVVERLCHKLCPLPVGVFRCGVNRRA